MIDKKKEDIEEVLPSETIEQKKTGDENEAKGLNRDGTQKQDPLKKELEKIHESDGEKRKKKLIYSRQRIEEQLRELGEEDIQDDQASEDDKPVTMGMLKKIQAQNATKTALQLADDIEDETERELTKYHIENTIRSTGNATKDLELAQVHVNAVKNKRIVEEITRKPEPRKHFSAGGGNPNDGKIQEEFTAQEQSFMRPPFNLTKEDILKARKQRQ